MMKKSILGAMTAAMLVMPVAMTPTVASAQQWHGGQQGWDPSHDYHDNGKRGHDRRLGRNDQVYRGNDGRYYCKRNDGTTGTVIGAIGGGAAGALLGGGTLGTLLGAGGGALLGRSIDRGNVKCR
jgi:hypothetical protein